ncbi:hypothetical protein E0H75_34380 [Kribbella capetownensis]|uniref:Uncharacterized protein n=1 Tax=Kribbella capetownensis TaxID=1572659 RepID=A0A4R0JCU1_9ACTN|nr:hypothetical protein [Kribbella capetownensis]TCC44653.1 hypothetical protein E0H75_34380 [Kribbella capetownensis]
MNNAVHTKQSMTTRLCRLAAGAAVSVALMTVAAPAMAQEYPEPNYGTYERNSDPPQEPASVGAGEVDRSSVALGALCGIALGGVGAGIVLDIQRRRDRSAEDSA